MILISLWSPSEVATLLLVLDCLLKVSPIAGSLVTTFIDIGSSKMARLRRLLLVLDLRSTNAALVVVGACMYE